MPVKTGAKAEVVLKMLLVCEGIITWRHVDGDSLTSAGS